MADKSVLDQQCEAFINALESLGGNAGNLALRKNLGWDEETYRRVRDALVGDREISLGKGQGGSVRRVDIEGLDPDGSGEDNDVRTYPLNSVHVRQEQRTIIDVLRRIKQNFIKLDPDFQREFVWKEDKQSRLVESVLMRIPLPVFYVAEDKTGNFVVVDGLQRLTTLKRFRNNELQLSLRNSELNGKSFRTISGQLKNRFEDGQLTFYIIDSKAPERIRLDIFERVNSGEPLTKQQMRNALYNGPATRLLRELADSDEFKQATSGAFSGPDSTTEQRDREVINRFLAFRVHGWRTYTKQPDMAEFLGSALREVNEMEAAKRDELREGFLRSMRLNQQIFGHHAFRKHKGENDRRHPISAPLFEVFSVLLFPYTENRITQASAANLRRGFYKLMDNKKFQWAISAGTGKTDSVSDRFGLAEALIHEVFGAP